MERHVRISGIGVVIPELVTNDVIAQHIADFNPRQPEERGGIYSRALAFDWNDWKPTNNLDGWDPDTSFAIEAAREALEDAHKKASKVDAIFCATTTPGFYGTPDTGALVHKGLGCKPTTYANCFVTGCAGGLQQVIMGWSSIKSGLFNSVLVIGSNSTSSFIEPLKNNYEAQRVNRRNFLFADAGAAILLESCGKNDPGRIEHVYIGTAGERKEKAGVYFSLGGAEQPITTENVNGLPPHFVQQSKVVVKYGSIYLIRATNGILKATGWKKQEVDNWIVHQATPMLIQYVIGKLKIDSKKVCIMSHEVGNPVNASIFLGIDKKRESIFSRGTRTIVSSIGAGWQFGGFSIES